jgi:hypothetical protein
MARTKRSHHRDGTAAASDADPGGRGRDGYPLRQITSKSVFGGEHGGINGRGDAPNSTIDETNQAKDVWALKIKNPDE